MYLHLLLAIVFVMTLSACATESITGQNAQASHHEQHAVKVVRCPEQDQAPRIECSETVTATFDKLGKLWVAWVDHEHIYLQSSVDKGEHFSTPVMVNQNVEAIASHGEYRPKLKLDDVGNLYFTWTQTLEKRNTGHIRFSRSVDGGKSFSAPITINDNSDIIGHRFDSLAVGKNGELLIAWLDARDKEQPKASQQEFLGTSLYYAWSDNGGKSFHPNQIAAPHSCECCRLSMEVDPQNRPVILWRHVFAGNIRDHALMTFHDWQTPGDVVRVSHENWNIEACPHHGPSLAIAQDGVFHAAWFSGATDNQGLFYAYSKQGGLEFSQPYPFGNQGAGHPSLAALEQQVAIVWTQFDGNNNQLLLIRSYDEGQSWSVPLVIGSTVKSADDAFVLSDGKQFYVSWQTAENYQLIPLDGYFSVK